MQMKHTNEHPVWMYQPHSFKYYMGMLRSCLESLSRIEIALECCQDDEKVFFLTQIKASEKLFSRRPGMIGNCR